MLRSAWLLMGLALAAATGCAQCDTCDDFPAPCNGPNCGGGGGVGPVGPGGFVPPTQDGLPYGAARMTPPVDNPDPATTGGPTGDASGLPTPATPPPGLGGPDSMPNQ